MHNKKSKIAAILVLVTAVLMIGFMILLPFSPYDTDEGNGFAAFFILLFSFFGYAVIYASAIPFTIVALVFGVKMLKAQSREVLISLNTRMLITTCVLLPFLAAGIFGSSGSIFQSKLGALPIVYTIIVAVAYFACLIAQIITIVTLKKSPEKSTRKVSE